MSGTLNLTTEQYKSREHALESLGNGNYRVIGQTGFKRGEEVSYDGEVNKMLMLDVTPVEELNAEPPQSATEPDMSINADELATEAEPVHDEPVVEPVDDAMQDGVNDAQTEPITEVPSAPVNKSFFNKFKSKKK